MTSFLLETKGEEVVLTTVHHNGTSFMPIHDGIVVPNDLSYLAEVSALLTQMGDRNEFRFPLSKCKLYGPKQMGCAGGNTQKFGQTEMSGFYLTTSSIKELVMGMEFNQIKVTLSVYIEGYPPVQDIVMIYSEDECEMNF